MKIKFTSLILCLSCFSTLTIAQDPFFYLQWWMENTGDEIIVPEGDITNITYHAKAESDVGSMRSNFINKLSRKIKVAVIDSGIDINHPDLKNIIRRNEQECQNQQNYLQCLNTESNKDICHQKYALLDSDQNGYPRDCHGWNVAAPMNKHTKLQGHPNVNDEIGHGTHISGIIGGEQNNQMGIQGMANQIEIIPIKTTGSSEVPPKTANPIDLFAVALKYAIANQVDIINMSFGWKFTQNSPAVREQIKNAAKNNILLVAAAGNSGNLQTVYPCAFPEVICVGAHLPNDQIAAFSSLGNQVDIYAPGLHILSTYPLNRRSFKFLLQKGYEFMNGTSQAAPIVTGALVKLLQSGHSPQQAKEQILKYTRPGFHPLFPNYAFPIIDLEKVEKKIISAQNLIKLEEKIPPYFFLKRKTHQYSIKIKNNSDRPVVLNLDVKSLSQEIELSRSENNQLSFAPSETKNIPLIIQLPQDEEISANQEIILNFTDAESGEQYQLTTIFTFFDFAEQSSIPKNSYSLVRFPPNLLDHTFVNFRNLSANKQKKSEFVFYKNNGEQTLVSSLIFKQNEAQILKPIMIKEKDLVLINASRLDLNLDGKLDYFMYFLKRKEVFNSRLNKNEQKFFSHFLVLDHNFEKMKNYPLPDKFANNDIILSGKMSFHPNKTKTLIIPYWISFGTFEHPTLQSPWEDIEPKQIPQNNIYYFKQDKKLTQKLSKESESEPVQLLIQNRAGIDSPLSYVITRNKKGRYFLSTFNGDSLNVITEINQAGLDLQNFRIIPLKSKSGHRVAFYNESLPGDLIFYFLSFHHKSKQFSESIYELNDKDDITQLINILPQENEDHVIIFKTTTSLGVHHQSRKHTSYAKDFFSRDNMTFNLFHNNQTLLLSQRSQKDRSDKFLQLKKGSEGNYFLHLNATKNFLPNNDCQFLANEFGFWSHTDSVFYFCPQKKQILELNLSF